jgi:hypothetical protein
LMNCSWHQEHLHTIAFKATKWIKEGSYSIFIATMGKDSKAVCALKSMKMPQIKMWMLISTCCRAWNFQACMGCYHMVYVRSKDEWNKDK